MKPDRSLFRCFWFRALRVAGVVCCAIGLQAPAAEIVVVEGDRFNAELQTLTATQVELRTEKPGVKKALSLDDLVRWGDPVASPPRPQVWLRDGSRLTAAISLNRHGAVELDATELRIKQAVLAPSTFPRESVRALLFQAVRDPALHADALREAEIHQGEDDRLWLANGDVLTGSLLGVQERTVRMQIAGEAIPIPLSKVAALALRALPPKQTTPANLIVGLRDGTLLYTRSASLRSGRFTAKLVCGGAVTTSKAGGVVFLQGQGPRVAYLSDLDPVDYRLTPYFEVAWPYQRDRNLLGQPLEAGGQIWLKGLAVHSAARLVYRFDQPWRRFEAELAIDDAASRGRSNLGGSVTFRVAIARDGQVQSVYESPVVRGGDPPRSISVDIGDASALVLLVDYADFGDQQDHANWLGARLLK